MKTAVNSRIQIKDKCSSNTLLLMTHQEKEMIFFQMCSVALLKKQLTANVWVSTRSVRPYFH